MIILKSAKDAKRIQNMQLRQFIRKWLQQLEDDDPQIGLYASNSAIGSLSDVWIAESEEEIQDKDFIEVIQVSMKEELLFVGTWIPTDGRPCADIFILATILSNKVLQRLAAQVSGEIEDF